MSSYTRRIQRKRKRSRPDYEGGEQPHRMHSDGIGYDALHPTKGWRRVSALRVRHQFAVANLLT